MAPSTPAGTVRIRLGLLNILVFASYVLLTVSFWGAFVLQRGLSGETGLIELSDTRPGLDGFIYPYDPARKFMSASFHLAYLLSNGSYLSLQLLFGTLILLTGWLAYLIVRSLVPQSLVFAFLVGALSLTFGADQGVNWLGYTVQRQTTVLGLLAIWLLLVSWERKIPWLLLLVAVSQYISLWTYEGFLPALLAVPVLLYTRSCNIRRLISYATVWSVIPFIKFASLVYSNWIRHEQSYEASVLAHKVTGAMLLQHLAFYISNGLEFWNWLGFPLSQAAGCTTDALRKIAAPVLGGVLVLVISYLLIRHLSGPITASLGRKSLIIALIGSFFLILSYVPFILLEAPSFLRTQIISAVPAAVVMVALCTWLDSASHSRGLLIVCVSALIVGCGLSSGLLQQLGLNHDWAGYRKIMKAIVDAAPCFKDDTMVVLVGVPNRISYSVCANDPGFDPFRDVMWFNSGIQVLYPHTKLVGIYYRTDGSGSDSIRFKFAPQGAILDHAGIGLEGDHFGYEQMVAFRYEENAGAVLLDTFPSGLDPVSDTRGHYRPRDRTACTAPSDLGRRRLN